MFTIKVLTEIFSEFKGLPNQSIEVKEVTTDSREKTTNGLFIPISGENFDGHTFVTEAIKNGAVATLWDKQKPLPPNLPEDFAVFYVDDTLIALQKLAKTYRDKVNPIVIAITGSNGKTTTKDLVAQIVQSTYNTHYTLGNLNNHIGMPLTILGMKPDTEVLVVEMGMSNFGEIDLLSRIAKPDFCIITNIGESHIEFLGSREGIAKAKLEIINGMKENGKVIIDGDEQLLQCLHGKRNIITCGFGKKNDFVIEDVQIEQLATTFSLSPFGYLSIPLLGKHHAKNTSYALVIGKLLKVSFEKSKTSLNAFKQTGMRFELVEGKNEVSIINDTYNASPTSMKAAIEVVKQMKGFHQKVLVLGDILELGDFSEKLHAEIAEVIHPPITTLFTYGEHAKQISTAVEKMGEGITCKHFETKDALLEEIDFYLNKNTLILFKASRGLKFETFVKKIVETK